MQRRLAKVNDRVVLGRLEVAARRLAERPRLGKLCSEGADLNEREVIDLFIEQSFFTALGYGAIGEDLRLEQHVRRGRADVVLRGVTGRPICVIEFKRPGIELAQHEAQLEEYVQELLPDYAVLTNGASLWLYRRRGERLEIEARLQLVESSEAQARELYQCLHKRQVDWQRLPAAQAALRECRESAIGITSPEEEGGRIFLQQFALSPRVAFGRLAQTLFESLPPLLKRSDFTRGAYALGAAHGKSF